MIMVVYIFLLFYYCYPNKRKRLVRIAVLSIPVALGALGAYQIIRGGDDLAGIGYSDLLEGMGLIEFNFPHWFGIVKSTEWELSNLTDYLMWLFQLPLPGGLKFGDYDPGLNYKITELCTERFRGDNYFSVILGGLVTESYYIYNKFFFVHGIMIGSLMMIVYNFLFSHREYITLALYVLVSFAYETARGGVCSTFPMIFKHLIIFWLVIFFYKNHQNISRIKA